MVDRPLLPRGPNAVTKSFQDSRTGSSFQNLGKKQILGPGATSTGIRAVGELDGARVLSCKDLRSVSQLTLCRGPTRPQKGGIQMPCTRFLSTHSLSTHSLSTPSERRPVGVSLIVLCAAAISVGSALEAQVLGDPVPEEDGPSDHWTMASYDTLGTHHNRGETSLSVDNVGDLEVEWVFDSARAGPREKHCR